MLGAVLLLVPSIGIHAQIALPSLQVPPLGQGAIDVNQTVAAATPAGLNQLRDLRRLRIRDLLRTQRVALAAGPRGFPVVRNEVVALSPAPEALAAAQANGFSIVRERALEGLDTRIVILDAPAGWSIQRALRRLRALDPAGTYDLNHVYFESGAAPTDVAVPQSEAPQDAASAGPGIRVGLIDTGIDLAHPVFSHAVVYRHGCGDASFPSPHGTAVASLLMGRSETFHGAVPDARLYAADVYCGAATGGAVDAVAEAFGWLSRERVPVINVSLVGPANAILEKVVQLMIKRGHVIVAAVGNDGPSAPAMYPASYDGVIGVTAVDEKRRVLLEAARGKQVDFAAPGADMIAANGSLGFSAVRGTSFAAPLVAGLLARSMSSLDVAAANRALVDLVGQAIDLGARGPDRIYGNGLLGQELKVAPQVAGLQ